MSKKKYLVEDHPVLQYYFDTNYAKEVEVLDEKSIDQIGFTYDNESSLLLSEILKANKYLIVKIIE